MRHYLFIVIMAVWAILLYTALSMKKQTMAMTIMSKVGDIIRDADSLALPPPSSRTVQFIDHGREGYVLITAAQASVDPLTKERLDLSYQPGGPALPPFQRVYSVGVMPIAAIHALGNRIGWGKLDNFQPMAVDKPDEEWAFRFTADGTGMKASGRHVPGGVILDWWK